MLIRVFKEVAKPTLCREKIGKSWHETVVLAALGQFFRELVEGWIPSTITWSRAVYGHGTTIFSSSKVTVSSTVDLADYQTSFCCETSYCQDFFYLDILHRGKDVSPASRPLRQLPRIMLSGIIYYIVHFIALCKPTQPAYLRCCFPAS